MFRVQTQVLDLHYHNEAQAPAFQDRARRLYYSALLSEMEAVMAKHDPRESIFRIHKLELDLGEMDEENFDTEWVKRFRERFEEELEKRLRLIRTEKGTAEDSQIPLKKRQIEIFEHYLLNGSLPWNAGDEKLTPQSMAEELLSHHPKDLIRVLKKHGSNAKAIQRLVFQLSEKQIIRIVETVQPTEAKVIIETVEKVDHTRRKESFVKTDSVNFRARLWQLALRYVLEDRGSYFNTKEFVKAMLYGIADHFNMERLQLIVQFYKAILHLQKAVSLSATLWRILAEIHAETLETQQNPFPFTPTFSPAETPGTPWYEGAVGSTYSDDVGRYVGEPLPFVVSPDGFAGKGKSASEKYDIGRAEVPHGFMPLGTNGKFSENRETAASSSIEYSTPGSLAEGETTPRQTAISSESTNHNSATNADAPLLEFGVPQTNTTQTGSHDAETVTTNRTSATDTDASLLAFGVSQTNTAQTGSHDAETATANRTSATDTDASLLAFGVPQTNTAQTGSHDAETATANRTSATDTDASLSAFGAAQTNATQTAVHDSETTNRTSATDADASLSAFGAAQTNAAQTAVHGSETANRTSATDTDASLVAAQAIHTAQTGTHATENNDSLPYTSASDAASYQAPAHTAQTDTHSAENNDSSFVSASDVAFAENSIPDVDLTELVAQLDEADMAQVVERLIFEPIYVDALAVWLWEKGSDSSFRRRMGNSIRTVEQFEKIVSAIDAPHAPYVAEFSKRLQADQEEHQLFPATAVQFRKDQYYVLLTVLLTRRGSYFNKKSFVKQVLLGLAQQYGMNFGQLIDSLVLTVPQHMRGLTQLPEILQLLNDLREDEIRVQNTQNNASEEYAPELLWERIEQWVTYGSQPPADKRFGSLNSMSFALLWETLLTQDEPDEKQTEHFFKQPKALRYLTQQLDTALYQKTLQRFVPAHRQPMLQLFSELVEQLRPTEGSAAASAAEFTRLHREWALGKIAATTAPTPSREMLLEEALSFLVEKLGYTPEALWQKIARVWQKTFTQASAAEVFFRKWAKKQYKNLSPTDRLFSNDIQTPDALTQHFLKTWGNASRHSQAFQTEVLRLVQLIGKKGETEVLKFLNRVFSTQTFPEFLAKHAQPEFLTALAHFPVQAYGYFLKAIVQDFRFLLRSASIHLPQAEAELTKAMLHSWFLGERTEKAFVERMWLRLAESKQTDPKTFKATLRLQAAAQQPELKSKLLLHLSAGEMPLPATAAPAPKPKPVVPAKPQVRTPGIPYGTKGQDQVLDSIQVNHAGLVLAWPFLTMYFKRLNLTENNVFIDEAAQHRAVHLLQFLSDPTPAPEPDLVLAKLMCGMQHDDPIPGGFVVSDDEKNLAESLIKGILAQWKEVSKTSMGTFRDSFLKRQGVLYLKNSGWELHPQSKTFDVLIDKLPWGVQIIKLPWMKTSLFCKWR